MKNGNAPVLLDKVGLPVVKSRSAKIQTVGGVGQGGANIANSRPLPKSLTCTLANATGSAVDFMIFDAIGAVAAAKGGTFVAPVFKGLGQSVINAQLATGNTYVFNGFNYKISTGTSSQFGQDFLAAAAQVDKSFNQVPIDVEINERNTQQNQLIQTVEQRIVVDSLFGLVVTVEANTTVQLAFFVEELIGGI